MYHLFISRVRLITNIDSAFLMISHHSRALIQMYTLTGHATGVAQKTPTDIRAAVNAENSKNGDSDGKLLVKYCALNSQEAKK